MRTLLGNLEIAWVGIASRNRLLFIIPERSNQMNLQYEENSRDLVTLHIYV